MDVAPSSDPKTPCIAWVIAAAAGVGSKHPPRQGKQPGAAVE